MSDRRLMEQLAELGYAVLEGVDPEQAGRKLGQTSQREYLSPKPQEDADPWSLSGVHGLGAFPWHSDGAVSQSPPRWLVLHARALSGETSTELLQPDEELWAELQRTVLKVTDRFGRVSYMPAAIPFEKSWRLRWDTRTCQPIGRASCELVESYEPTTVIEWRVGQTLIIDNYQLLHRRPAVASLKMRALDRIYVRDQ